MTINMTQKDKELLIRSISYKISYGIIVNVDGLFDAKLTSVNWHDEVSIEDSVGLYHISEVKPYLFPLSSMTKEQKQEYQYITERWMYDSSYSIGDSIDWLNSHHFDYRGLIEKGLAIDATGLNIY